MVAFINWDAITAMSTVGLVLTGVGAIYFAYRQIENERVYRRIENLEEQLRRFDGAPIAEHRKRLAEGRLNASRSELRSLDPEDPPSCAYELLNFFEHVAFLTEKGHLDIYDVWHSFDYWATAYYFDLRPVIEAEQQDDSSSYCDFVTLISHLRPIEMREAGQLSTWVADELVNFYDSELEDVKKPVKRRSPRMIEADSNRPKIKEDNARVRGSGL